MLFDHIILLRLSINLYYLCWLINLVVKYLIHLFCVWFNGKHVVNIVDPLILNDLFNGGSLLRIQVEEFNK